MQSGKSRLKFKLHLFKRYGTPTNSLRLVPRLICPLFIYWRFFLLSKFDETESALLSWQYND